MPACRFCLQMHTHVSIDITGIVSTLASLLLGVALVGTDTDTGGETCGVS